jgi:hypothetical protein
MLVCFIYFIFCTLYVCFEFITTLLQHRIGLLLQVDTSGDREQNQRWKAGIDIRCRIQGVKSLLLSFSPQSSSYFLIALLCVRVGSVFYIWSRSVVT